MTSANLRFGVAIVGGGVIGCSTAHFIKSMAPEAAVAVIEPDPTYEYASTLRASGGCRVQFSRPENIEMSLFSIDFIRKFDSLMRVQGKESPKVDWIEGGYLFIVPPESVKSLERNVAVQQSMGCVVGLLTPQKLKSKFPSMYVDDLGAVGATRMVSSGGFAGRPQRKVWSSWRPGSRRWIAHRA